MTTEDSPEILYPHWQEKYQAALIEVDSKRLPGRIEAAEKAIFDRLQELSQSSDHHTERRVMGDALQSLRFLKKKELGLPAVEKKP